MVNREMQSVSGEGCGHADDPRDMGTGENSPEIDSG